MIFKILLALLLSSASLLFPTSEAQACDSTKYNNFFAMADSAERVLVVRAAAWNQGTIVRAVKGAASDPLPPIVSNCDPSFTAGLDYLVFVGKGGQYYTDSSAFALLGDQGQGWIQAAEEWTATSDDRERSKILARLLDLEFALPSLYGQSRMLYEIANLPMPHATIDRKREIRLAKELARRQLLVRPDDYSTAWFQKARSASGMLLVQASRTPSSAVTETLSGQSRTGTSVRVSGAMMPGAHYLVLVNKKGQALARPFLVASAEQKQLVAFLRTWAAQGMKDKALRGFVRDRLIGSSRAHPLAYDAASHLTTRKQLNGRTCKVMRRHNWVPTDLARAIQKECRGPV